MKIVTVIQARRSSTRLPNKVLLPLADRELLVRMVERVAMAKYTGDIVVATTTEQNDDLIELICKREKFNCFRGNSTDLLDRHYQAGKKWKAEVVIKIPSDCPLIDPFIIDRVIEHYLENYPLYQFVSNLHPATYPDGNDVEVMDFAVLQEAWLEADKDFEREHTTPFIWERPKRYKISNVTWETGFNFSMSHRFTIDYQEDYELIKEIYNRLYCYKPNFSLSDILKLLAENPHIRLINKKYSGVNWYRNHMNELKTIDSNQTAFPA